MTGRVQVEGNPLEASVETTIFAIAEEQLIPGEVRVSQADASNDFTLFLQAGVTYTLSLSAPGPDGDRPVHTVSKRYDADSEETFTLTALEDFPTVSGRVIHRDGSQTIPVSNVRVTAVSQVTGLACTSATTGKLGEYRLRCPEAGKHVVSVRPTETGPVIPAFRARLEYGKALVDAWPIIKGTNSIGVDIVLPPLGAVRTVTVQVLDGNTPVSGADVALVLHLPDGGPTATWQDAVLRRSATTDSTGIAILEVVEGSYDMYVTPAAGEVWATFEQSGRTDPAERLEVQADTIVKPTLTRRPTLQGVLTSSDGLPVENARVALRRTVEDPGTGASVTREYVGQSDDAGAFTVAADAGSYELLVEPLSESGLPNWSRRGVELDPAGTEIDVRLASALVLEGTIFAPDGQQTVQRVAVQAFDVREDGVTVLARGRSDEYGRYFLILPSE